MSANTSTPQQSDAASGEGGHPIRGEQCVSS